MDNEFYDELAESYHLIFPDWDASIHYQAKVPCEPSACVNNRLPHPGLCLRHRHSGDRLVNARLSCGRFGLASEASIRRAMREATARGLAAEFRVDDMRGLSRARTSSYGAVIAMDNAIPHLQSEDDIQCALTSMRARLRPGGTLLTSLRETPRSSPKGQQVRPLRSIAKANFDASSTKFGIGKTNGATSCTFS